MDPEIVAPVETAAPVAEAPITPVEPAAEPADMGETIRARFREMNETPGEPVRGPDGKFTKAPGSEPEPAAEPAAVDEPAAEPVVEPPAEVQPPVTPEPPKTGEPDISKPPSSLTAAEKAVYEKADPVLKAAFH